MQIKTAMKLLAWLYYRDELGKVRRTRWVRVERHQQHGTQVPSTSRWFYCINCRRAMFGSLRWCCSHNTEHYNREDARPILWPRSDAIQATWLIGGPEAVEGLLNDSEPPSRQQLRVWGIK